jgi:hypothetical protein
MFDSSKVKLPATKQDESRTTKHPLVWALEDASDLGLTLADVARKMNVTPQTLWIWKERAKKNRNFLLPAEQIKALSEATGVPPYYFRPDLWPNPTWRF